MRLISKVCFLVWMNERHTDVRMWNIWVFFFFIWAKFSPWKCISIGARIFHFFDKILDTPNIMLSNSAVNCVLSWLPKRTTLWPKMMSVKWKCTKYAINMLALTAPITIVSIFLQNKPATSLSSALSPSRWLFITTITSYSNALHLNVRITEFRMFCLLDCAPFNRLNASKIK